MDKLFQELFQIVFPLSSLFQANRSYSVSQNQFEKNFPFLVFISKPDQ